MRPPACDPPCPLQASPARPLRTPPSWRSSRRRATRWVLRVLRVLRRGRRPSCRRTFDRPGLLMHAGPRAAPRLVTALSCAFALPLPALLPNALLPRRASYSSPSIPSPRSTAGAVHDRAHRRVRGAAAQGAGRGSVSAPVVCLNAAWFRPRWSRRAVATRRRCFRQHSWPAAARVAYPTLTTPSCCPGFFNLCAGVRRQEAGQLHQGGPGAG